MSFAKAQKRQREKARQEKAAIKRQRRLERGDESSDEPEVEHDAPPQGDVLAELAALHASFEAEEIPFEEFEERKQELLARLAV